MKVFSTFSGVEGIGLGLPPEWERVGFSEIDKYASMVLRHNNPNVTNYGDIKKIKWDEVPDFNFLTGGSPCQDFSIAGRRAGLSGTKSSLAWEYIRCLREKQPRYFLWENVKGVLSSRGGWDFANLLSAFSESGYSLWWQVLNAKDFGVPQNRERIFVLGVRGETPSEILFERGTVHEIIEHEYLAVALRNKDRSKHQGKSGQKYGDYPKNYHLEPQRDGLSFAVKDIAHENYIAKTIRVGGRSSPHGSKQNWDSYEVKGEIRRLTPVECERLMGWPDNHTQFGISETGETVEISDAQRYKMCGNGVVSPIVSELVRHHFP